MTTTPAKLTIPLPAPAMTSAAPSCKIVPANLAVTNPATEMMLPITTDQRQPRRSMTTLATGPTSRMTPVALESTIEAVKSSTSKSDIHVVLKIPSDQKKLYILTLEIISKWQNILILPKMARYSNQAKNAYFPIMSKTLILPKIFEKPYLAKN
jgi:hypothetical protein